MVDEKDKKILSILKEDASLTIKDISKKTKIRPSTVHQRIMRLKSSGIIQKYTVKCDNKSIDEGFVVFMLVNTTRDLDKDFLENSVVKEVFGVTGEYDLLIKLKFRDVEEFNSFLLDLRKKAPITKTLTMVGTANIKEEL